MFEFDETTPEELRNQILAYHMADLLTDSQRARFLGREGEVGNGGFGAFYFAKPRFG